MPKRSLIVFLAAVASFVVTWLVVSFVLDAEPHFGRADATTPTGALSKAEASEPSKIAHAANQTTTRILQLDQAKQHAYWTLVLKSKKQACDLVVRTRYQGGTEFGVDNWSISCRDGNQYSVSIDPGAQDSVCTRNTFTRSAELPGQ